MLPTYDCLLVKRIHQLYGMTYTNFAFTEQKDEKLLINFYIGVYLKKIICFILIMKSLFLLKNDNSECMLTVLIKYIYINLKIVMMKLKKKMFI